MSRIYGDALASRSHPGSGAPRGPGRSTRSYREPVDPRVSALVGRLAGNPRRARLVRAPGRVNLIGDHTDYNDGYCLPLAIDRDCIVGATLGRDDRIRAESLDTGERVDLPAQAPSPGVGSRWGRFVAAAAQVVADRGGRVAGTDLAVTSTVPIGAGLSSSAALCVALVLALGDSPNGEVDRIELARAARDVEQLATGVPVGLLDQLASVFGRRDAALFLDCRTLEIVPVPLPATLAVAVVHSGVARALESSAYATRRDACLTAAARLGLAALRDARPAQVADDPIARHVVSENGRVVDAVDAVRRGDLNRLGMLMGESHASLRDDFRVSTHELDTLVDALLDEGAIGARLTGAGFGGCVVAAIAAERRDEVLAGACRQYRMRTGREPRAFAVRAVDGAGAVEP
jgi:galactokinase